MSICVNSAAMSTMNVNVRNFRGPVLWARFRQVLRRRDLTIAEGLAEAVEDWLQRHETIDEKRHAVHEAGL